MINLKKTYFYSIIGTYLLLSLAIGENLVYLWDLGVKIESQPQIMMAPKKTKTELSENKKYAALTNPHVHPKLVNVEFIRNTISKTTPFIQEFSTLNYLEQYNLGSKYFTSGRYVEAIKLLEMVDFNQLSINQKTHLIKLHAESLMNLGHYSRIFNLLTENKTYDLNDELLFVLGMSSTELGEKDIALHAFNEIIEHYPNSEYQKISKLQVRVLKR